MVDLNYIASNFIDLALNLVSRVCAKFIYFVPLLVVFSSKSYEIVDHKPENFPDFIKSSLCLKFLGFRSKNGL